MSALAYGAAALPTTEFASSFSITSTTTCERCDAGSAEVVRMPRGRPGCAEAHAVADSDAIARATAVAPAVTAEAPIAAVAGPEVARRASLNVTRRFWSSSQSLKRTARTPSQKERVGT